VRCHLVSTLCEYAGGARVLGQLVGTLCEDDSVYALGSRCVVHLVSTLCEYASGVHWCAPCVSTLGRHVA